MLKYLIIQLCDSAPSFCHYKSARKPRLITIEALERGLMWAVKKGLSTQVVYPDYELPADYERVLGGYDHVSIGRDCDIETSDSVAIDGVTDTPVIMRLSIHDFLNRKHEIASKLKRYSRLNIVFDDVENFTDEMIEQYDEALSLLADEIYNISQQGGAVQLNLLTDRMLLTAMNNCNAGDENITLAPDGRFYVCPGFYFDGHASIGGVEEGVTIPNGQLYELKYAPICRRCDAFQCKRCIWLNKRLTLEVNTPSRQQCVMAHIEREAARRLLLRIRENGEFMPQVEISKLDYLDPFDIVKER